MREKILSSSMMRSAAWMPQQRTTSSTASLAFMAYYAKLTRRSSLHHRQVCPPILSINFRVHTDQIRMTTAKRLPYADQIVVLDKLGHVSEQGSFKALDTAGGYVSSFGLGSPEWKSKIDKPSVTDPARPKTLEPSKTEAIKEDPRRQSGDLSIYLYYIRSIGWLPTVIFLVAISGFVFCISFPSTVSLTLF